MSQIHRQQLQRALGLHQQGQILAAVQQYNAVLSLDPGNFDALQLKGLALYQLGDAKGAVELLNKAIRKNGSMASVFNNRGLAQQALGLRREALQDFSKAVLLQPNYAEALGNKANVLCELGQLREAESACLAAIRLSPQVPQLHNSLGVIRKAQKNWPAALELFERAIRLNPRYIDAIVNRANAMMELKRPAEALAGYAQAAAMQPPNAQLLGNIGNALSELERLEEALASHDRALSLAPGLAEAHNNRGSVLRKLGRFGEALAATERAIEIDPRHGGARSNRGAILRDVGRLEEAVAEYELALALTPDFVPALAGRARVLRDLGRFEEALACCDRALVLEPEQAEVLLNRSVLLRDLMRPEEAARDGAAYLRLAAGGEAAAEALAAQWTRLLAVDAVPSVYESEAELAGARARVEETLEGLLSDPEPAIAFSPAQREVAARGIAQLTGFYLAYHQENDRETMRKLSLCATRLIGVTPHVPEPSGTGRIRLGIASQRLRNHNGANWAYNWLAQLPPADYEFFTYNFEALEDDLSSKFARLGTHRQLTFAPAAQAGILQQMRADRLDVLMLPDVGMTAVSRFLSLHRIAPCQFTAWGHPVTTGSPAIDCYLSSDLMEPPDGEQHYTERLVRLPNLALYLDEPDIAGSPSPDFGLPDGRVLYGCLQSLYKYLPRHDDLFPLVAREVPDALFVFLEGQTPAMTAILRRRLERAFAAEGLDAGRHVLILPRQSARDYDALMRCMDVNVDTLGWSGGNTSLKSIAFGVPLLTMAGRFMRGRHTSAMFAMMGMEDMISSSREAYVAALVAMGREEGRRRDARDRLGQNAGKLYRDATFIGALDGFLKRCSSRPLAG